MEALSMKRTRNRGAEKRAASGICVIDGCGKTVRRRGLCETHANQFYHLLSSQPSAEARIKFEEEQIELGNVLPVGHQRRLRRDDPFTKSAAG